MLTAATTGGLQRHPARRAKGNGCPVPPASVSPWAGWRATKSRHASLHSPPAVIVVRQPAGRQVYVQRLNRLHRRFEAAPDILDRRQGTETGDPAI